MPKSFGTLNEILGDTNEKPSLKHHSQQFRAPENLGSLLDSMKYPGFFWISFREDKPWS